MSRRYDELTSGMDPVRRTRAEARAHYDIERRCGHYDSDARGELVQCPREGIQVRLRCPVGRPDAVAAYCDEHGGESRARIHASSSWDYVAPESVGDHDDVENAGCMGLQSPHAYVVVRQVAQEQGGKWLAWLGLGSLLTPVANPNGQRRNRGGRMGKYADRPATSFPTRSEALEAATIAWRCGLQARVEAIRRARGGSLDWGTPVEPLSEPIIIVLEQGDSRSAWDVAQHLSRRSRDGGGIFSGLRPSGEAF